MKNIMTIGNIFPHVKCFYKDIHMEYHFLWRKFTSDSEKDFLIKGSNNHRHLTLSIFLVIKKLYPLGSKEHLLRFTTFSLYGHITLPQPLGPEPLNRGPWLSQFTWKGGVDQTTLTLTVNVNWYLKYFNCFCF